MIPQIEARLSAENIPFDLVPSEGPMDPYRMARDFEIDAFSIMVAVGGDGTYHEVVNGMLAREDGLSLPIAVIPNGSGNDFCSSLGIFDLD